MKRLTTEVTPCQRIEVWGSAQEVEFRVAGAIHAWWHRERFLTGLAWDAICAAVLLRAAGPPRSLLMLGLGGGTALRQLRFLVPDLRVTAVELDPGMISLAAKFMHLDDLDIEIVEGDAYDWLLKNRKPFDAIVDDVYGSGVHDVHRPTVYTPQLADALRRSLASGGVFVANLVTGPGHRTMQSAFRRFFRSTFPCVRSVAAPHSLNESLAGGDALSPPSVLHPYHHLWSHRRDRTLWQQLRCRRIGSRFSG
ncbi:MAG: fused MFS/spermidine synthase [Verrucomicrobiales bacterium]|nr:fused MFS/spermidine synthase [Verrucomicrobiales bacterium]